MEVSVVGVWVEMGDSCGELDGREDAPALLCAGLFSGRRQRLDGGQGVGGDRSRAATAVEEADDQPLCYVLCCQYTPRLARKGAVLRGVEVAIAPSGG